jgi:hypothetical protein
LRRRKILFNPNVLPFQDGPVDKNPFMWKPRASAKGPRPSSQMLNQRMRPDSPFNQALSGMEDAALSDFLAGFERPLQRGTDTIGQEVGKPIDFFQRGLSLARRK